MIDDFALEPNYSSTNFTSPFNVLPPSNITGVQTFEVDSSGILNNVLKLSWYASQGGGVDKYQVEYKIRTSGEWKLAGQTQTNGITIKNLYAGSYSFRVKAINTIGYESAYEYKDLDIVNSTDVPSNVENFVLKNGNKSVTLTWASVPAVS